MQIKEVMTRSVETISRNASIAEAAKIMRTLDTGFLPVTDTDKERLIGVATDRDIVLRCVARGRNPADTPIQDVISEKVLYCFADQDVETAASSMAEQQVYRLVVLDGPESKRLAGVVTLSDIRRHGAKEVAEPAADQIVEAG